MMNLSFNENNLSGIILNCFPKHYDDKYYLNNSSVPSEIGRLRDKLVQIKKVVGNHISVVGNSTASNDMSTIGATRFAQRQLKKGDSKKLKDVTRSVRKHCQLCTEHGGVLSELTTQRIVKSRIVMAKC